MADQLLTVEVVAELEALGVGLSKGTKYLTAFSANTDNLLKGIEARLKDLGIGSLNGFSEALAKQKLENEKLRGEVLQGKVAEDTRKAAIQGSTNELVRQKAETEQARTEQVKFRTELMQGKVDIDAAACSYDETRQELTALGREIKAAGGAMDGSNPHIAGMMVKYGQLNDKLKTVDSTMGNFQRNVGNYSMKSGMALTDLGRIAQDLPYGFMAIQNNLNPMLESFGRLKEETGSTGGALKAMAGALTGPAGIGVALAVVSAGILLYQKYQQSSKKETEEARKAVTDYAESLEQVTQAHLKGGIAALKEQTELKTLYEITQNVTLSNKDRTAAVDELQNKYPAYFKNIDDEVIKNGGAQAAYDRLTTSIIATARARAAQDLITKNSTRGLENEQKLADAEIAYGKAKLDQQKALNGLKSAGQGGSSRFNAHEAENAEKEQAKWAKVITDLKTDDNILNSRNLKLTESITEEIKNGAVLGGKVGSIDAPKRVKDIKTLSDVLKDLNIELLQAANNSTGTFGDQQKDRVNAYQKAINALIQMGLNPANDAIVRLKKSQDDLSVGDLGPVGKPADIVSLTPKAAEVHPVLNIVPMITGMSEFERQMQEFNERVGEVLNGSVQDTLGGLGSAIGEALANGGNVIDALGMSLLQSLGGFLSEYGRLLIAYGAAAVLKSKLDAAALIPGAGLIAGPAAIAAGIALQVAGSAVGSFASGSRSKKDSVGTRDSGPQYGVPHFATGAIVSGPTLAMVGEYPGAAHDPEVISPLSKLKGMMGNNGGGSQPVFNVIQKISMGQLVVEIERQGRNDSRG